MDEYWTHTHRQPYDRRTKKLHLIEEAPPHDGTTFWFLDERGLQRAFKTTDPHLKPVTKKVRRK